MKNKTEKHNTEETNRKHKNKMAELLIPNTPIIT